MNIKSNTKCLLRIYLLFQVREQLDIFGDLELKLSSVGQHNDKICFGDYNARTGTKLDYLEAEDNTDIPIPLDSYKTDIMNELPRQNIDSGTNKYGKLLLSLCKSVPLRICNGRKLGDILGSYTYFTPNGQSCVDYCMVSPRLYNNVQTFSVGQVSTLSDHCPIRAVIKVRHFTEIIQEDYNFVNSPSKIAWSNEISCRFENILQSPEYLLKADNFISTYSSSSQDDIDMATRTLTDLLVEGALQANISETNQIDRKMGGKQGGKPKKNRKKFSHPKWHDLSCDEAHRKVSATSRLLKGDPKNVSLRSKLRKDIKEYNKLVKLKNKQFVDNMFVELDSMENNNPRGYMELIRSMRDGGFDKATSDDTSGIKPVTWHNHFSNLLAKKVDLDSNLTKSIEENINLIDNELNEAFTLGELTAALKDLKNNKASSFDRVSNEMLKVSGNILKDLKTRQAC